MQLPVGQNRTLNGRMWLFVGLGLLIWPSAAFSQQPVATTPTIPAPAMNKATQRYSILHPETTQPAQPVPGNGHTEPADAPELTLGECISMALERQPSIRAVKASHEASQVGLRALNNIGRIGSVLSPDLPIRKEQAARGLAASAADCQKTVNEVIQDTTRLYYTAVYAQQQYLIADDVVVHLITWIDISEKILNSPMPGTMTKAKLNSMRIGLASAIDLRAKAMGGRKKAIAALNEIMALEEATFPFHIKDTELPVMAQNVPLTKEQVVEMALTRRPEMALASAAVDAFRLEVYAQGEIPFRRAVPTLASGSDIHARELPQTNRDRDYRPGAIIPEMPTQLVGTKYDRVCRAMAYSRRADAVFDRTHNLIVLEATDTFYNLELASEGLTQGKDKLKYGKEVTEYVVAQFSESKDKEQLVQAYVIAARAQSEYLESVLQHLIALSALERVTAGGVKPAFPGR